MINQFIYIVLFLIAASIGFAVYLIKSFKDPIGKTIPYDANIKIYPGGGCNSVVLTSEGGERALVVDTKYFSGAKMLRKEINSSDITIVNTHCHMDHTRGNKLYPGAYVISGTCSWKQWDFDTGHCKRPDNVLNPGEEAIIDFDDEKVHIINVGSAHTATDCVVYLEKRRILIAGDIIWNKIHPMVLDPYSNISTWINTLDRLDAEFEINTIIPGHGEVSDKSSLTEMREYFESIRNAINDPKKLELLKNRYKEYKSIPLTNGFDKTVNRITNI